MRDLFLRLILVKQLESSGLSNIVVSFRTVQGAADGGVTCPSTAHNPQPVQLCTSQVVYLKIVKVVVLGHLVYKTLLDDVLLICSKRVFYGKQSEVLAGTKDTRVSISLRRVGLPHQGLRTDAAHSCREK